MDERIPAINVVMSVYNGASHLYRGVDSILAQTFSDWEMIIVDDGSKDDTWSILQQYAARDTRIRIIKNDINQGLAYSLNRAISLAKSNILARQDADDCSAKNRFEVQYPFVRDHPQYAIVGTAWYNVNGDRQTPYLPKEYPEIKDMVWDGGFMHPSWMMRKDILSKVGFYTEGERTHRDQDYHLVMKIYSIGMKMCNMQQFLYYYTNDCDTFRRTKNWERVKGLMWIRWDGYQRNHLPFWYYIFILKPMVKNILPTRITHYYYMRKRYHE